MTAVAAETDARFSVAACVRACELDGEVVLLDIERGEYFGLGELGSRAWGGLCAGRGVSELAGELVEQYDVDLATLSADLSRFVLELQQAGLLVRAPS